MSSRNFIPGRREFDAYGSRVIETSVEGMGAAVLGTGSLGMGVERGRRERRCRGLKLVRTMSS